MPRRGFSKPHLSEPGWHQGCGRGFICDEEVVDDESSQSRRELESYLTRALQDEPEVELFTGLLAGPWSIPEGEPPPEPSKREPFTTAELTRPRPAFDE